MDYNENAPDDVFERLFLDSLLHEYLICIFFKSDIEYWVDTISDRKPVTEHGNAEIEEFNKSLELIRKNLNDVRFIFSNNAFRKR